MPTNKNALTRYMLIDKILANRYRAFSIQDITDYLAEKLPDYNQEPVSKRCIEKDINYLQFESPFIVEIEEYWIDASDRNGRPYRKRCIRYSDPTFSIFKPKLTEDEKTVLSTALDSLGGFDGLENFEWLSDLKQRLHLEEHPSIISISKNILSNSTLIARLYTLIQSKQVITLHYHTFDYALQREANVIPRLIKEYNNRWFLIASACDTGKVLTFPLDRIDHFDKNHNIPFVNAPYDIEERYEDIIGVTYIEDAPIEDVVFWVSDKSKDYVNTKPLHGSQSKFRNMGEIEMRMQYPHLTNGAFFKIQCKRNYELIRELSSFGAELIVLSPESIVETIYNRVIAMAHSYKHLTNIFKKSIP